MSRLGAIDDRIVEILREQADLDPGNPWLTAEELDIEASLPSLDRKYRVVRRAIRRLQEQGMPIVAGPGGFCLLRKEDALMKTRLQLRIQALGDRIRADLREQARLVRILAIA